MIVIVATNGVGILVGLVILLIGIAAGRFLAMIVRGLCEKRNLDVTLSKFFASVTKLIIITFAAIMALDQIGISVSPLIALLGASAFGLTLALQGPVSNYGAGLAIILTRPFKVTDTLTVQDQSGIVDKITLGSTQLVNEDGQVITIPNRKVLGEILTNSAELSIIEASVGIEYSADPEAAIKVISDALKSVPDIDEEKEPQVGIDEFADSSVNIGYRIWVSTASYHTSRFAANMAIWKALKAAEIGIPFPQRDVRIIHEKNTD